MNTLHSSKNIHTHPSGAFNVDVENQTELEYVSNVLEALYRLCAQLNVFLMTLANLDLPFLGSDGKTEIELMAQHTSQCSWKNNIPLQNRYSRKTEKKNNFNPLLRAQAGSPSKKTKFTPSNSPFLKKLKAFATDLTRPRLCRRKNGHL